MIAKVLGESSVGMTSEENLQDQSVKKLSVYDKKIKVEVIGENFEIRVSKLSGDITSLIYCGYEYLVEPLKVVFDENEVLEDLDQANINKILFRILKEGNRKEKANEVELVHIDNYGDYVEICIQRKVRNLRNGLLTSYMIDHLGNLTIKNKLTPKKDIYRFGTTMTICKGIDLLTWTTNSSKRNVKSVESCKLISGGDRYAKKGNSVKYKIKARKSDIKKFRAVNEGGDGLNFEAVNDQALSVRANYNGCTNEDSLRSLKQGRLKDTVVINLDYREKNKVENLYGGENYEEEYKLKKNIEYEYAYKISNALI